MKSRMVENHQLNNLDHIRTGLFSLMAIERYYREPIEDEFPGKE
jgi:hypothetical protein